MPYKSPVDEIAFCMEHLVCFDRVQATERFAEATPDLVRAVLEEAGRICDTALAPLNHVGDREPARLENGVVRSAPGLAEGYRAVAEGGWIGMAAAEQHGGMALPGTLNTALNDMMSGANLALQLLVLLSQGQIEALEAHASDELKELYLPKLNAGDWNATMNLTEPQAGSDVGALRARAEPNGDGTFSVTGQKIFITWGDTDITRNTIHLVLARLGDAPAGTRGLSLFLVPKLLPDADSNPGERNNVRVATIEHKMGLHSSPTCVMDFAGAKGWLVGNEGGGMKAMFTMMNNARLGVGIEGIGVAEAATQAAAAFAAERVQGRPLRHETGTIADHADVRRMLREMRADTFAARAIAFECSVALDLAKATGGKAWAARAAFLTPIAKAFGTDTGISVASLAMQVHGGVGYMEDTGVAQYLRDVRVTAIYEGTNGIQAMDLVGRKLMDGGDAAFHLLDEIEAGAESARARLPDLAGLVWQAAASLREMTEKLVAEPDMNTRFAGAAAYLRAFARVLGAHIHLKAALADTRRVPLATFYLKRLLPEYLMLIAQVEAGAAGLYDNDASPAVQSA